MANNNFVISNSPKRNKEPETHITDDHSAESDYLEVDGTLYRLDGKLYERHETMLLSGEHTAFVKRFQKRVAIKIQQNDDGWNDGEDLSSGLPLEYRSYQQLHKSRSIQGVPKLHGYATKSDYAVLVIDLLGPSLADLRAYIKQRIGAPKFSLRTVLVLAIQLLRILKRIHNRGLVHRDIKPQNIAIGLADKQRQFYIFDFDVADQVKEPSRDWFAGTYFFASARVHQDLTACRADDLESLLYTLIFLVKGTLPWLDALDEDEVAQHKQRITTEDLCHDLPEAFAYYHRYIRNLDAMVEPKYQRLINRFETCFAKEGYSWGYDFEWVLEAEKEAKAGNSTSTDSSSN